MAALKLEVDDVAAEFVPKLVTLAGVKFGRDLISPALGGTEPGDVVLYKIGTCSRAIGQAR